MKPSTAATLLACTATRVQAFSDSSPFILFSTANLPALSSPAPVQLQTSSQVLAAAKSLLASCPTGRYVLVSQPNMHAADFNDRTAGCRLPNLCRALEQRRDHGTSWSVAEVIGQVSGRPLAEYVVEVCAAQGVEAQVDRVELKHLPAVSDVEGREGERGALLGDNDHELGQLLDVLDDDYTVMVFSDPNEFKAYQPDFAEPVHMDMKRWAEEPVLVARNKSNSTSSLPLFEKYQFFTPGIFMSFIVLGILLSILGVGLKAIASLDVSYGAFDKEMGPAAQKQKM